MSKRPARDLIVRPPRSADGPRMRDLLMMGFERHGWVPPCGLRTRPDLARAAVAEVGGKMVGVGLLAPAEATYRSAADGAGWITDGPFPEVATGDLALTALVVDPAFRRRGVGRALAWARVEMAELTGARSLFVQCPEGSGCAELYLGLGFRPLVRRWRPVGGSGASTLLAAGLPFSGS